MDPELSRASLGGSGGMECGNLTSIAPWLPWDKNDEKNMFRGETIFGEHQAVRWLGEGL